MIMTSTWQFLLSFEADEKMLLILPVFGPCCLCVVIYLHLLL